MVIALKIKIVAGKIYKEENRPTVDKAVAGDVSSERVLWPTQTKAIDMEWRARRVRRQPK